MHASFEKEGGRSQAVRILYYIAGVVTGECINHSMSSISGHVILVTQAQCLCRWPPTPPP